MIHLQPKKMHRGTQDITHLFPSGAGDSSGKLCRQKKTDGIDCQTRMEPRAAPQLIVENGWKTNAEEAQEEGRERPRKSHHRR
jgi:hypothetical protein